MLQLGHVFDGGCLFPSDASTQKRLRLTGGNGSLTAIVSGRKFSSRIAEVALPKAAAMFKPSSAHIHFDSSCDGSGMPATVSSPRDGGKIMASGLSEKVFVLSRSHVRGAVAAGLLGLGFLTPALLAKEPILTAIELYDGASSAGYIQLTDVLISGKAEMRSCPGSETAPVDKSAYGKLSKITLAVGGVLDRGADGVLRYGTGAGPGVCVLPDNVKFEHNAVFTPAAMADLADLKGSAVGPGSDGAAGAQPLKRGAKLVFVSAPNPEMGEYLLARRVGSIPGWQGYLGHYSGSAHSEEAKRVLAGLYVDAGEKSLSIYQKTAGSSPSYSDLKDAFTAEGQAHAVLPDFPPSVKLAGEINASLTGITDKGRAELVAYTAALKAQTAGYVHLQKANSLSEAALRIDPTFAPARKLQTDVAASTGVFEAAMKAAATAQEAKQWDDAIKAIGPYRAFAPEEPRISGVIEGGYAFYYDQGKQCELTKDWKTCIADYQKALSTKETGEAQASLKDAQNQLKTTEDEVAARTASDKSKAAEAAKDMITAYEVLANLPPSQQAIVADEVTRLAPFYVTAASARAKELVKMYPVVQGMGDEQEVEVAYTFLQRAYQTSTDENVKSGLKVRMDSLGDELSAWFLSRAKHYLQKPVGSGTELGWAYLKEAEAYKAANLEDVRDQIKVAETAHAMHSRLSIRVQFRDQTSQRQSEGFASQMENSIVTGLDGSGLPVKVLRFGETTPQGVEPDFMLAGDVLEHHIAATPTIESVDSKFVAATHDIQNEEWNKADRTYDSANSQLESARSALQGAEAKGNKKEVEDKNRLLSAAQKKWDDARATLDSIPKTKTEDVIRPYTYKRTTYDVVNRLTLQFRIDDQFSAQRGEAVQVPKEDKKQFVVTSDVNSQDSNGIKAQGTVPDTNTLQEFQTELENSARGELNNKVLDKVGALPSKLYDTGHKREVESDPEDAGEAYLRYLNVTPDDQSPERAHAVKFLRDQFNFPNFPSYNR
jgi:tetratricopeptide (TPR) repeat protein